MNITSAKYMADIKTGENACINIVSEGKLKDKKFFVADKILAKHDENYMPPEVSEALKKQE